MTVDDIISEALNLQGNTALTTQALGWLNRFLQAEYRRKYPWQRKPVTISAVVGSASYPAAWDTTFLDTYEQKDGSCGRYVTSGNAVVKLWEQDYREYIARADRIAAQGPPARIVPDPVGATWHVWPVPDAAYTITVDIYWLPGLLTTGQTPLWSSHAPDEILVQAVKVAAAYYDDDDRYAAEKTILFGDARQQVPGMLPTYRRRVFAEQGTAHQTAFDQRVFQRMPEDL